MKRLAPLALAAALAPLPAAEPVPLFNGENLDGWSPSMANDNPKSAFTVRDGKLVSLGDPKGSLVTDEAYADYRLTVEYRFAGEPGNCGVLVHVSELLAYGNRWPKSIEVQMQSGHAGDFWCILENIEVPDMDKRRPVEPGQKIGVEEGDARRILNLTDDSEKPVGEWNTITITCRDDQIRVEVNGELVNHGHDATATKGRIALQSEGSEVEFRKVELTPLAD